MSSTESYTELLDLGREKLSEGDYLKLAAFLQTLHKEAESEIVMRVKTNILNCCVSFQTYKNKKYNIKIEKEEITVYRGSTQNKTVLYGSVNGQEFHLDEDVFYANWTRLIEYHGIKHIERSLLGSEKELFKNLQDFKMFLAKKAKKNGEDDVMVDYWRDEYIVKQLFGVEWGEQIV